MTEQKYYGIFDVCYDTYSKNNFDVKKLHLIQDAVNNPDTTYFGRSSVVFDSRTGNDIKCAIIHKRQMYEYDRKYSRCHRFKTKYFIHETYKNGLLKPSKKELEAVAELNKADAEAIARQEAEKQAQSGIC